MGRGAAAATLAGRLLQTLLALLLLSVVAFSLPRLAGGDPAATLYGLDASAADRAQLRADLGLDRPLPEQYVRWLGAASRGDLGRSLRSGQPALRAVAERLPATALLAVAAALLGTALGLALGLGCALAAGTLGDRLGAALAAAACAAPGFWVGLLLLYLFAYELRWLPFGGPAPPEAAGLPLSPAHLLLPALALGARELGRVALLLRASLLDALAQPYARVAAAKGLSASAVALRHALPNALGPVVSSAGLALSYLLGGAIAVESVFAWPGLGRLMAEAAASRDFAVLAAGVLAAGLGALLGGLAADAGQLLLDPRSRAGRPDAARPSATARA